MALSAGTRLGPYEIVSPLGAGGMGEVYRAKDTRLDRAVAIKVLNSSLAATPDLKARFEREARTISQLNHPNICTLHDVGHDGGTDFLVMEFIEGESLAERLKKGPLPLDQLLKIGIETADALDKAHRSGIVHRDLKPGNVMLTKTGAKLLDFGLAKPLATAAGASGIGSGSSASVLSAAMTMTSPASPLTSAGSIVGTVQYMSPEQIHGAEADARSDIFAFGVMLFEMATGKHAFAGKTQSAVVGSILAVDPPPVSSLQPSAPPALDRIVRICLEKDPNDRYQCAHDLMLSLQAIAETPATATTSAAATSVRGISRSVWFATATALLIAVAAAGYFASLALQPKPVVHAYILPPGKAQFSTGFGAGAPVISPDGSKLAFVARNEQGKPMLYVQPLSSPTAQPLAGTEDPSHPFWSPDSRSLGFFAGNLVKRIEADGGPAQTVCAAASTNERGGAWSASGTILFGYGSTVSPLSRVSAGGGTPAPALKFESGENAHRWPQFLPDGKHFLFFVNTSKADATGIYVGSIDSTTRKLVVHTATHAQYAPPGYLLFLREQTLMAQPFSLSRLEVTGEAVPIAEPVSANIGIRRAIFSVSDNGVLVYRSGGSSSSGSQLLWFDRQGKQLGKVGGEEPYSTPAISPDGTRVAVDISASGNSDIWIFDLSRGTKTRLTFGPASNRSPLWTPDGESIVFSSNRKGLYHIYRKAADNSGPEEVVLESNASEQAYAISHDGRYLVYERNDAAGKTGVDIWALPLFGERKPFPVVETQFSEIMPAISPDGKWMAYSNNESGRYEVYVTPFPGGGAKSQVSTGGGVIPQWRRDGRELYFQTEDQHVAAVDVSTRGAAIQLGTPRTLFQASMIQANNGGFTTLDGKRFLVNALSTSTEGGDPFTLITNWPGLLKK